MRFERRVIGRLDSATIGLRTWSTSRSRRIMLSVIVVLVICIVIEPSG